MEKTTFFKAKTPGKFIYGVMTLKKTNSFRPLVRHNRT